MLRVNESLIVSLKDIEQIKPSTSGVLTNCVVRQSTCGSDYTIELVAFGPDNESEYEKLLHELYVKKSGYDAYKAAKLNINKELRDHRRSRSLTRRRDVRASFRSRSVSPYKSGRSPVKPAQEEYPTYVPEIRSGGPPNFLDRAQKYRPSTTIVITLFVVSCILILSVKYVF